MSQNQYNYQELIQTEILKFQKEQNNTANNISNNIPNNMPQYNIKKNVSDNDLEYRDTINDKLSNMKLTLPTQQKAVHTLDIGFINNNPQFQSQSNVQKQNIESINVTKKDNRDGMNNKMDLLMFQRFENQEIPSSIKINEQQNYSQSFFSHSTPQNQNYTRNQTQNYTGNQSHNQNQNNNAQSYSRFNSRDEHNNRLQEFSSLPRALYQPTKQLNNPHIFSYQNSYENQYKSYDSTSQFQDVRIQHPEISQNSQLLNNDLPLTMNYLPNTNESARVNYKDAHNERLQGLSPLARTCAIPNSDYTKSLEQNAMQLNLGRITKEEFQNNTNRNTGNTGNNGNNRNTMNPQMNNVNRSNINISNRKTVQNQNNWYLSNNINPVGPPPTAIIRDNRPSNTRNDF
jgi:hypothetical protein